MKEQQKIVDILSRFRLDGIYVKYHQAIFYLFFGGVSTLVNLAAFGLCNYLFGINYQISNVISWILAVLCAYITNKLWVFESRGKSRRENVGEAALFYFFRIVSLGIEMGIMYIMIDMMDLNVMLSKIVANVISIIANFFFSKLIIFRKSAVHE